MIMVIYGFIKAFLLYILLCNSRLAVSVEILTDDWVEVGGYMSERDG